MNIFLYGSLMYEVVWSRVVKGRYAAYPSLIRGWRRCCVTGEDYPAAIAGNGSIEGVVRIGISPADVTALDRFEGDEYSRVSCTAETLSLEKFDAWFYRFNDAYYHRLSDREWNRTEFEQSGLSRFITSYTGFQAIGSW
ncbi:MAG: gamma-glutamylcyclotransferase family protein [Pseudomonadota bacterium]